MMQPSEKSAAPKKVYRLDDPAAQAGGDGRADERRRRAERARTWKNLRFLLSLVFLAGLFAGGYWAAKTVTQQPYFNFMKLHLSGDIARVPVNRVKVAVESALRGNYFTADLTPVRQEILTLPWVKATTVRRRWPDTLEIRVTAYKALALYEDGRLVSREGRLFEANPEERGNWRTPLPNFNGPVAQVGVITRYYREFSRAIAPLGARILSIDCTDRGSWSFVMASPEMPPTRVVLGQERPGEDGVVSRLVDVVSAYPQVVELMDGPPGSIDVRYNRAFAATLPDRQAIKQLQQTHRADPSAEHGEKQNHE